MSDSSDSIVKVVELSAPISRVWRAVSDYKEFGRWFRVELDQPVEAGKASTGRMTNEGCEHMKWLADIEAVEPERRLVFRWRDVDEAGEPRFDIPATRVEFMLEPSGHGTRLTIAESGFSALPEPRRLEMLRGNREGGDIQGENIAAHLASDGR